MMLGAAVGRLAEVLWAWLDVARISRDERESTLQAQGDTGKEPRSAR